MAKEIVKQTDSELTPVDSSPLPTDTPLVLELVSRVFASPSAFARLQATLRQFQRDNHLTTDSFPSERLLEVSFQGPGILSEAEVNALMVDPKSLLLLRAILSHDEQLPTPWVEFVNRAL